MWPGGIVSFVSHGKLATMTTLRYVRSGGCHAPDERPRPNPAKFEGDENGDAADDADAASDAADDEDEDEDDDEDEEPRRSFSRRRTFSSASSSSSSIEMTSSRAGRRGRCRFLRSSSPSSIEMTCSGAGRLRPALPACWVASVCVASSSISMTV